MTSSNYTTEISGGLWSSIQFMKSSWALFHDTSYSFIPHGAALEQPQKLARIYSSLIMSNKVGSSWIFLVMPLEQEPGFYQQVDSGGRLMCVLSE